MQAYVVLVSLFLLEIAIGEKSLRPTRKCVPTATIHGPCHVCVCHTDGVNHCQGKVCEEAANETVTRHRDKGLPEIKEGNPCTPGLSYKMDCNRCHCTNAKKLICTKIACLDWSNFINHHSEKLRQGVMKTGVPKSAAKRIVTSTKKGPGMYAMPDKTKEIVSSTRKGPALYVVPDSNKKVETFTQNGPGMIAIPVLPKGRCVPGRTYKNGCRLCFCNDKSRALCSNNDKIACIMEQGRPRPIRQPEDVRPPFKREELKKIKELSSESQKCEPGKTFKVSCNTCICTERNNLLCTKELCLSFADINRVEARERSGKKCSGDEVTKRDCMECKCIKGKTSCKQIDNCVIETRERLSKGNGADLKMKIDPDKDKCIPNGIYTDHCNRCYCQPDGSLRCTQKTCLNFSQSKALDEQFQKLKEKGL